jgi:hydrogenase maturation protein HypF
MAAHRMCPACAAEYHDPTDRRFHAQTIACPDCGPVLRWHGPGADQDPVGAAAAVIGAGGIVAIKGIGGFHLACRADDPTAVALLRRRKHRPAKPFAVMVADLGAAHRIGALGPAAQAQLCSPAAPIVLVPARDTALTAAVAPRCGDIGLVLPYSPVHHLLFDRLGAAPLVMTSANEGGSPIMYRDSDLDRLTRLADGVLTHDRAIHVPCEDSVVTVAANGAVIPIRRSRGYAPLPVSIDTGHGRHGAGHPGHRGRSQDDVRAARRHRPGPPVGAPRRYVRPAHTDLFRVRPPAPGVDDRPAGSGHRLRYASVLRHHRVGAPHRAERRAGAAPPRPRGVPARRARPPGHPGGGGGL